MIHGLQIVVASEELGRRISERIDEHQSKVDALDERLAARANDLSFDVRPEDDFKTVGDLRAERRFYAGRASALLLLRNNLVPGETYSLTRADLEVAELIAPDPRQQDDRVPVDLEARRNDCGPVEGLRLAFTGAQLRERLEERIRSHRAREARWIGEAGRTLEDQTEEAPLLPEPMCTHEAECEAWRAERLEFIRDHIDPIAIYRLGANDLEFGELMPEKPRAMEQEEYEARTAVGFHLERLVKEVGACRWGFHALGPAS